MLTRLYIENLAVIEQAEIDFDNGLTVFTGETGAGKSIVIDAVNAVLGGRTSKDIVRTGANKAVIIAQFNGLSRNLKLKLNEFGIDADDELIIQREISVDGKSNARILSRPVAISVLKELACDLINIHGQHDNQIIMSVDNHIRILDSYAHTARYLEEYTIKYEEYLSLVKKLESLNIDDTMKAQRIDLLSFQVDEIFSADLSVEEEEELQRKHEAIKNSSKIVENLNSAYEKLFGYEGFQGATDLVSGASYDVSVALNYYEALTALNERMESVSIELSEIASELSDVLENIEFDDDEINRVESRLDELFKLKRKYGQSVTEILEYYNKAKAELEEMSFADEYKEKLTVKINSIRKQLMQMAKKIQIIRKESADEFVKTVSEQLEFLDMPNVRFEIKFSEVELYSLGIDKVEILISTNPGETPKSVSKIASGGELSRIMLAIKNTMADIDDSDTMIFDEIDTGVSGSGSQKIGLVLKQVSKNRQVICVTHSAQIAAQADKHLFISKSVKDDRTYTKVELLDFEGRKQELARIIGTDKITKLTLDNAEEMLKMANNS